MLVTRPKKILIVPDYGKPVNDPFMLALKEAIESNIRFKVKIIDLKQMVLDEYSGAEIKDSSVIGQSAGRLGMLVSDESIEWGDRSVTLSIEYGAPDVLVVFGKSAMLTGNVKDKLILFIDPIYESEWPWKKQYYADCNPASEYLGGFINEIQREEDTQVLWMGAEVRRRPRPTSRFCIFTDIDASNYTEFRRRYHNLAMIDEDLNGNPDKLAKAICDFTLGKMEFPLFEIYQIIRDMPKNCDNSEICRFDEPVKLSHATVIGLKYGIPMGIGQSGIKLVETHGSCSLPLEGILHRRGLTAIREALEKLVQKLPAKKRVLIVPDYFKPYNAPNVFFLRNYFSI